MHIIGPIATILYIIILEGLYTYTHTHIYTSMYIYNIDNISMRQFIYLNVNNNIQNII